MSTAKPPKGSGGTKNPSGSSAKSRLSPKGKSKGFIESSDFKPSWLETGPLSPDILPAPATIETENLADEFDALQAALQRFYGAETDDSTTPVEAEGERSEPLEESLPPTAETVAIEAAAAEVPAGLDVPEVAEVPALIPSQEEPIPANDQAAEVEPQETPSPLPSANLTTFEEPQAIETPFAAAMMLEEATPQIVEEPPLDTGSLPAFDDETLLEAMADTVALPELDLDVLAFDETDTGTGDSADQPAAENMPFAESTFGAEPEEFEATVDPETPWQPDYVLEPPATAEAEDVDEPEMAEDVALAASATDSHVEVAIPTEAKARRSKGPRRARPSRLSAGLLALSLLLIGLAALIYFVNPFTRLALGMASLARPTTSPAIVPLPQASGNWCLQGDFLDESALPALADGGANGDILAEDGVFALQYPVAAPGAYNWRVADCNDAAIAYPPEPAWITTAEPNQAVTFFFASDERTDALFFPIAYAVGALDGTTDYRVVGSFQGWDPADPGGRMERINSGLYQQIRRIARSGSYEAYVVAGSANEAIDAYGRTTQPIPFAFETKRARDYVVFLLDTDRGRASVLYDMPPLVTRLAFGNGYWLLSAVLAGLALLLLLFLLSRELTLRNPRLQLEGGCPRCHEHELMRIARRNREHLLHALGIPAYRYRCRNCTWEGTRISETGQTVSPGASIARVESVR